VGDSTKDRERWDGSRSGIDSNGNSTERLSIRHLEGPRSSHRGCGSVEPRSREGRSRMQSRDDLWEAQYLMLRRMTSAHLLWTGDLTLRKGCEHRGFGR
jgi:hypothetical protein